MRTGYNFAARAWTVEEDALVLARGEPDRALAGQFGRTVDAIQQRRAKLLRRGRRARRPWLPWEDDWLRQQVGATTAAAIAARLGRTERAVESRAWELGLSWKRPPAVVTWTASDVARQIGVRCSKTVAWWISAGYLRGEQGPHLPRGGRPAWRVRPDDLRAFLREYPWLYDRARISDPDLAAYVATLPPAEFVGVGEAARRLGYTEAGIANLIRHGYLPGEKRGPNWLIPVAALANFVRPPRGSAARGQRTHKAATLSERRTGGYHTRPETLARQVAARANTHAAKLLRDPAALAARVGLSAADVAFWLPRLPVGCPPARVVEKLTEIAALRREAAPTVWSPGWRAS